MNTGNMFGTFKLTGVDTSAEIELNIFCMESTAAVVVETVDEFIRVKICFMQALSS